MFVRGDDLPRFAKKKGRRESCFIALPNAERTHTATVDVVAPDWIDHASGIRMSSPDQISNRSRNPPHNRRHGTDRHPRDTPHDGSCTAHESPNEPENRWRFNAHRM